MTEDVAVLQQMVYDLQQEYPLRPTLLDQFAGQALIGLMACTNVYRAKKGNGDMETFQEFSARVAGNAYDAAEAMLRERANRMSLSGGATS